MKQFLSKHVCLYLPFAFLFVHSLWNYLMCYRNFVNFGRSSNHAFGLNLWLVPLPYWRFKYYIVIQEQNDMSVCLDSTFSPKSLTSPIIYSLFFVSFFPCLILMKFFINLFLGSLSASDPSFVSSTRSLL